MSVNRTVRYFKRRKDLPVLVKVLMDFNYCISREGIAMYEQVEDEMYFRGRVSCQKKFPCRVPARSTLLC